MQHQFFDVLALQRPHFHQLFLFLSGHQPPFPILFLDLLDADFQHWGEMVMDCIRCLLYILEWEAKGQKEQGGIWTHECRWSTCMTLPAIDRSVYKKGGKPKEEWIAYFGQIDDAARDIHLTLQSVTSGIFYF